MDLARDYETRPSNSEAMITPAMIDKLARRITDETTPTWLTPNHKWSRTRPGEELHSCAGLRTTWGAESARCRA